MLMASASSPPRNIRKYQKMQSWCITRTEEKFLPIIWRWMQVLSRSKQAREPRIDRYSRQSRKCLWYAIPTEHVTSWQILPLKNNSNESERLKKQGRKHSVRQKCQIPSKRQLWRKLHQQRIQRKQPSWPRKVCVWKFGFAAIRQRWCLTRKSILLRLLSSIWAKPR